MHPSAPDAAAWLRGWPPLRAAAGVVREWCGALLDIVFPRACAACGGPVGAESLHLCRDCLLAIEIIQSPYCARCGDPVSGRIEHEYVCSACRATPPAFDLARSAARFQGGLREALHTFKYGNGVHLRSDLGMLLRACVETHYAVSDFDALTYVPLYHAKERERTYNQSHVLAAELARALGKLVFRHVARVRATPSQTTLTTRERALNVKNAFQVLERRWLEGRSVLLIDDVMTTGATVNEVARVLKEAGAPRVLVATVARG
jgi:ComF family protein